MALTGGVYFGETVLDWRKVRLGRLTARLLERLIVWGEWHHRAWPRLSLVGWAAISKPVSIVTAAVAINLKHLEVAMFIFYSNAPIYFIPSNLIGNMTR